MSPLYTRMLCAKFGWNWHICFGEEYYFKFCVFYLFCYNFPSEKNVALRLNKLEVPLPMYALCQVWLKFAKWAWRRFWNFINIFSLFCYTWYEGIALHFNKLVYTLYQMMLYAKFGLNWPSTSGENNENVKSLQTNRLTDYAQQTKIKA